MFKRWYRHCLTYKYKKRGVMDIWLHIFGHHHTKSNNTVADYLHHYNRRLCIPV